MSLSPRHLSQYHVFLASPGDVDVERQHVRQFFERYNRQTAQLWNVRFEVVDWENYSTIGVGRPQELITKQTLEKYRESLVLVVGIMGQRFGSPTGKAESGTEEEFHWAMESHETHGFPDIKWFFRKIDRLDMPTDPAQARKAIEQWEKVLAFRRRMQDIANSVLYSEYPGPAGFRDVFENDLNRWLADSSRPWVAGRAVMMKVTTRTLSPPSKYFENVERDFRRLDIAGIDNDRTFEIPLSEIYVRLRVMFDEDATDETEDHENGAIDIQTAMLRYPKLVIVGDPGSGKSTFLKYIALMLARSFLMANPGIALEKLCLPEPLPIPIFLSCWDLADFLKQRQQARLITLLEFVANRLAAYDFLLSTDDVEELLDAGTCCLLFDGLDEVPTDAGRAAVSRLVEDCVERYGGNRFVVTSRIRAYTGDTILKAQFTRCDIQPFDGNDRTEFIRNWVAVLFRIPPADVEIEGSEAGREFISLGRGIETSDRIRPLAVNPLLLTVIAIVHWNRKRLPEQRVELYDECVDVLLGQRKEAEHIQLSRKTSAMDVFHEEQTHEERAWVRKRFAEIALHILSQDGDRDEASKADLSKLLAPRFIDRGAANDEQAAVRAELFLDRQELRSGLLVSRRAQTYRFVHLTFQEYLAAWQLSNMDFDKVTEIIQSRLRMAKWFEALQLLGGQWAKESDEKADRYIAWLLSKRGTSISDQAPVVALCANVVKDISGVAELSPQTRTDFKDAVETTLDALRKGSGVAAKTQLEILKALGQLGAGVKSYLIGATKASLPQVRRRAIDMLVPHLCHEELFGLEHIWQDRSRKPIKAFLMALMERNRKRALQTLTQVRPMSHECAHGIWEAYNEISDLEDADSRAIVEFLATRASGPSAAAIKALAAKWPDETTRALLAKRAVEDENPDTRCAAIQGLALKWPDETTRALLAKRAVEDENPDTRCAAIQGLALKWPDETTRALLAKRAVEDEDSDTRCAAIQGLAAKWPDETTRALLAKRAVKDESPTARKAAFQALAATWPDEITRALLTQLAVKDEIPTARKAAFQALAATWPDESTRALLAQRAVQDKDSDTRRAAIHALWPDETKRALLAQRAVNDTSPTSRGAALQALAEEWPDESTRTLLAQLAVNDESPTARRAALQALVVKWPDETKRASLAERAVNDTSPTSRSAALQALVATWPDENTRVLLVQQAVEDENSDTRGAAIQSLAAKWPNETTRALLAQRAVKDSSQYARSAAIHALASTWPDESTRALLAQRAVQDDHSGPRRAALRALAAKWPDESTLALLAERAVEDDHDGPRRAAFEALAAKWPDENTRALLVQRAVRDPSSKARGAACSALGKMTSEFGRILPTRDLDGRGPYLDPLEPIPREHIAQAAQKASIHPDDIDAQVASLSAYLGWDLTRGAKESG